jgi:hypothetical protein
VLTPIPPGMGKFAGSLIENVIVQSEVAFSEQEGQPSAPCLVAGGRCG